MLTARRMLITLSFAVTLALTGGLLASPVAMASPPPDPTLGLTALQAKIEASPAKALPGYFKTVLRGSAIETIPCTVLAITGDATPDSALILFKATGAAINDIGGIAEGMSGSPIYIDDSGVEKVIGAVSYGDEFTVGGTGLATPIEAMLEIEHTYSPQVQSLAKPVITSEGLIDRVIVAPNPEDFRGASESGAFVAKPLTSIFVGGLRADSAIFTALKAELAANGLAVSARTTPGTGTSTLDTPLVAGASVSSLASRGDMWIGSIGTVTYADGDDVLAYGHPAHWLGDSDEFLCNATIDGVWPSLSTPYKLGRPATLKGTVTQDRTAGILGQLGTFPAETTITVHAVNPSTGKSADSAVYFPRSFVSQGLLGPSAFSAATFVAGSELFDQENVSGSAEITTTIVFGDGTHTYQVVLPDRIDSYGMLPQTVTADTAQVVSALDSVVADERDTIDIASVDVEVRFSKQRTGATILSVDAPNGLKTGANRIVVQLAPHGTVGTRTVETTLSVPTNMPLTGSLLAVSGGGLHTGGRNVAEIYNSLTDWSPSSQLWVAYSSTNYDEDDEDYYGISIETSLSTPWVLDGYATANITRIYASASPSTLAYGRSARVTGLVVTSSYSIPETATVYVLDAGQTHERRLGTYDVYASDGAGSFSFPTGVLTSNARIRIHTDGVLPYSPYGGAGATSADAYLQIKVGASVALSSSTKSAKTGSTVKLTTKVVPASAAGGSVTFEYYDSARKTWRKIATRSLAASGGSANASATWKALLGTHKIRVRYLGGTVNAATTSGVVQVKGT